MRYALWVIFVERSGRTEIADLEMVAVEYV